MYLASLDDDAPVEKADPGQTGRKITLPQDTIMQSWSSKDFCRRPRGARWILPIFPVPPCVCTGPTNPISGTSMMVRCLP